MKAHSKPIEIQGHRGAPGLRPENTLPSFAAAIEGSADRLELDIMMTKDGELVIYHDFFINPALTLNLDGNLVSLPAPLIHSLTLSQLKKFDCGAKKNPLFPKQIAIPGTLIPTLQEIFTLLEELPHPNAKKIGLNLEVKRNPHHPEWSAKPSILAKALADLVQKNGFSGRIYYSSFDPEILLEIRKRNPQAVIAFLKEGDVDKLAQTASELQANIVSPEQHFIREKSFLDSLHRLGFKVITWTVNDHNRSFELVKMGIDGIITDYPQDLVLFLKERQERC